MYSVAATNHEQEVQDRLHWLAQDIASELSELESTQSKALLGAFVSELFYSISEQERRKERRQRQAEGIAAAKAKGKKFGRPARPMPENFYEIHQAWREGKLVLQDAADACGMPQSTFYDKAIAYERTVGIT